MENDEQQVIIEGSYIFGQVPLSLMVHPDVDSATCAIFAALWTFSDARDRSCFPSRRKIAERASLSVDTVDRRIKLLTKLGMLRVETRKSNDGSHTSNRYYLIPTALEKVAASSNSVAARSDYR